VWRRLVSWLDTSAGNVAGASTRRRAGLQALPERKAQRRPDGPAWTCPPVVEQPAGSSAPAAQPAVLASAGNPAQLPVVRTARPDSVTLPCVTPGVTAGGSMLIMVTWHGHPVTAADSQPWCRAPRLTGTWPPSGAPCST